MARDPERLLAGLRQYLPDGDRISRVEPLSLGHSNETYLLHGIDRVLRMPPANGGLVPPYDMARQYATLVALHGKEGAPPVPRPRELCLDSSVIGDPFFVMDRVLGEAWEYVPPAWLTAGGESIRAGMCEQWMDAMTALHRFGPLDCLGEPRTAVEEAARWRDLAADAGSPELADLLQDVIDVPGPTTGAPTCVWGDAKLANILWSEDGRLQAIVDLELACNGEPLADLGYALMWFTPVGEQPLRAGYDLPGVWSRSKVIAEWEGRTGRSAAGLEWYEALGIAKIGAVMAVGAKLFTEGRTTDPRMAGWVGRPSRQAALARTRLQAWRNLH